MQGIMEKLVVALIVIHIEVSSGLSASLFTTELDKESRVKVNVHGESGERILDVEKYTPIEMDDNSDGFYEVSNVTENAQNGTLTNNNESTPVINLKRSNRFNRQNDMESVYTNEFDIPDFNYKWLEDYDYLNISLPEDPDYIATTDDVLEGSTTFDTFKPVLDSTTERDFIESEDLTSKLASNELTVASTYSSLKQELYSTLTMTSEYNVHMLPTFTEAIEVSSSSSSLKPDFIDSVDNWDAIDNIEILPSTTMDPSNIPAGGKEMVTSRSEQNAKSNIDVSTVGNVEYMYFEKLKEDIKKMEGNNVSFKEKFDHGRSSNAAVTSSFKGIMALNSIEPAAIEVGYPKYSVLHLASTTINGHIVLSYSTFEKQIFIDVIDDDFRVWTLLKLDGNGPCTFMNPHGKQLVACTVKSKSNKPKQEVIIFELKMAENLPPKSIQTLTDFYKVGGLDSWQQKDKFFLLVAESESVVHEKIASYETKSWLYQWNGRQFTAYQQFPGGSTRIPHHFKINDNHFIALPNFVDNGGNHNLNTEIFLFDEPRKSFLHFQSIPSFGPTQVSSFTLGSSKATEYFLVIVNTCKDDGEFCNQDTNSTIYRYNPEGKFLHFQCVETHSAFRWETLQIEDQVVITVLNVESGITFYQYDGWKFSKVHPVIPYELSQPGLTDMANLWYEDDALLIVGSASREGYRTLRIYRFNFARQEPIENVKSLISRWCRNAITTLNAYTDEIKRNMANLPLKNRPIKFERINVKKLKVESRSVVQVVDRGIIKKIESRISDMENKLKDVGQTLDAIESTISNSINLNETINWPDNLHFTSVVILAAKTNEFQTKFINEYEVPSVEDLIPIDDDSVQLDLQRKTFSEIKVKEVTLKNLNGYPISSYGTTNGNHNFEGHISFSSLSIPGMDLGGVIDGVNVTDKLLFLKTRDQEFIGSLHCNRLITSRLQTNYINNVNVQLLMKDTAINSSSVILKGNLTVLGDLIYPKDLTVKTLSGKNLQKLNESVLLKSKGKQVITGKFSLGEAKIGKLHISNSLNGLEFPDSVFINSPENAYHVSRAHFSDLSVNKVVVDKELNGIKVIDGQLDVLTKSGDQQVYGFKQFHHIHLDNHKRSLPVNPNLSNLNEGLSSVSKHSLQRNRDRFHEIASLSEQHKNSESLLKAFTIVKAYVVELAATKPVLPPSNLGLTYEDNSESVVKDSLNSLYKHLQTFKLFVENEDKDAVTALVHKDFSRSDIHNIRKVSEMSTVSFDLQLKLENFYDIVDNVIVVIENKISKVQEETLSRYNIISAAVKDLHDDNSKLRPDNFVGSGGSKVAGDISGYNFDELRISKNEIDISNISLSTIEDADKIIFLGNLIAPSINNVDIEKLLKRIIPLSSPEVNLNFLFNGDVVVQGNLEAPFINGLDSKSFAKLSGTNVFEKPMKFKSLRIDDDVEVKGKVNNFSLKNQASQIALITGFQNFNSKISFWSLKTDGLECENVMLQDTPLEDYVLRSDAQHVISGTKQFSSVTILNSTVNIKDLRTEILDGVNISKSIENGRVAHHDVRISDHRIVNKLLVKGKVEIKGTIQRSGQPQKYDLKKLQKEVAYLDEENYFSGDLVFGGKIYVKDFTFRDTFDDVSYEDFDDGFALIKQNQTIRGKNLFKNLKVKNLVIKNNLLQGVDLFSLDNKTAKIDEDTHFPNNMFFESLKSVMPVNVEGLVQGWNLTRDAVLKSKPATFSAPKTFLQSVAVSGDVDVKSLVNGFEFESRCNEIIGTITIEGPANFRKDLRTGRLSTGDFSVPDSENKYWMTDKKTSLPSDIVFDWVHTNNLDVSKELNNEPIKTILREQINCEEAAAGKWTFGNLVSKTFVTDDVKVSYLDKEDSNILERILVNGTNQELKSALKVLDLKIEGSLSLHGRLNGLKLTNICRRSHTCVITGPKIFMSHFTVQQNWVVNDNSFINKLNVGDIKSVDELPSVNVVIEGSLQAPALYVDGFVNDIRFDANTIMTLSTNQTMIGTLLISNRGGISLSAKKAKILSNLYNGFNVTSLDTYSMKMRRDIGNEELEVDPELIENFMKLGRHSLHVSQILRDQVVTFTGWEVVQEFKDLISISPLLSSADSFDKSAANFIALISHNEVKLMTHVPVSNVYKDLGVTISVNCSTDAKGFYKGRDLFFASSCNCPNNFNLTGITKVKPEGINMDEKVFSFVWKVTPKGAKMYAAIATTEASQVLIFNIGGRDCILFISVRAERQNIMCEDNGEFILQQSIQTDHSIKALHMIYVTSEGHEESLLILGTSDYYDQQKLSKVKIMKYNHLFGHFDHLQNIHCERLIDLASSKFNQDFYLATIHQPFYDSVMGNVQIFRVSENTSRNDPSNQNIEFRWEETIVVDNPVQASFMETPSKNLLLLVLTKNGFINRYQKNGFEKFKLKGVIHLPGKTNMETWNWHGDEIYNLAVSGITCEGQVGRYSKIRSRSTIFKPTFKGLEDEHL